MGELFKANVSDGSQVCSTYDSQWAFDWSGGVNGGPANDGTSCAKSPAGGCDGQPSGSVAAGTFKCATEPRTATNGFFPTSPLVHPAENPFYLDLPYDDVNDTTAFGERCSVIPWAKAIDPAGAHCKDTAYSYMKNRWVRIQGYAGQFCYGQIEDAGPSHGKLYHDAAYVFGANDVQPVQGQFNNAGMDVSPALNGCLGFLYLDDDRDTINWQFVDDKDVPPGPWKTIVTTSGVKN